MKLTKTEKRVLAVIDGELDFENLHYKNKFGRTKTADNATQKLLDKGILIVGADNILKRKDLKSVESLIADHFDVNFNAVLNVHDDVYNVNFPFNRNLASKEIQISKQKLEEDEDFKLVFSSANYYFYEFKL